MTCSIRKIHPILSIIIATLTPTEEAYLEPSKRATVALEIPFPFTNTKDLLFHLCFQNNKKIQSLHEYAMPVHSDGPARNFKQKVLLKTVSRISDID